MVIYNIQEIGLIETNPSKKTLVMFPFAGGNSYSYQRLIIHLEAHYNIICPELKGRGVYSDQQPLDDINLLVDELYNTWIKKIILVGEYVLYGHSMGAMICYLLSCKISANQLKMPNEIILSGRGAPACVRKKIKHNLAENEFKTELKKLGGVSDDILNDDELLAYFMPILRADFKAVETYKHIAKEKLHIPITVITGKDESIEEKDIFAWQDETRKRVNFYQLEGDHFFIFKNISKLCSIINSCATSVDNKVVIVNEKMVCS